MAEVDINLPSAAGRRWKKYTPKRWRGKVEYVQEFFLASLDGRNHKCPVCEAVTPVKTVVHLARTCDQCGMFDARYQDQMGRWKLRLCLWSFDMAVTGDSARKQTARIKHRDAALDEARRLWARRADPDCRVFHFGEVAPEDWMSVGVMADWLDDNGFPMNAKAARLLAEYRKVGARAPALVVPEMQFKPKEPG